MRNKVLFFIYYYPLLSMLISNICNGKENLQRDWGALHARNECEINVDILD